MKQKRIRQIERRIDRIKTALLEIGAMRPGSLTRQYKDPQHHAGAYWQISYTRRMKSRTEYVRREWVKNLRRQYNALGSRDSRDGYYLLSRSGQRRQPLTAQVVQPSSWRRRQFGSAPVSRGVPPSPTYETSPTARSGTLIPVRSGRDLSR